MINFLKDVLAHSDDIAYGAGSELYNKMVVDTQDRHKKFTRWGNEVQNSLNLRKKELQAEEKNYSTFLNNIKSKVDSDIESDMLSKGIDLNTYLAPLDSQLGTGLFLGEEKDILPRVKYFLKNTPIEKDTPYVPSETYFKDNYAKLDNQMQHISGLGYNTWRTLTKKGELSMVEDVKPVEFSKESMAKARHELTVNLENYDLWEQAGSPAQNNFSKFGKYMLIKKQAENMATNEDTGEIDFRAAIAFEREMIEDEEIDLNQLGAFFGVDATTVRQMSTQGNYHLQAASSLITEAASLPSGPNTAAQRADALVKASGHMKNAVNFAVNINKELIAGFGGKEEYDVSKTSRTAVAKIKTSLGENSKEFFTEYLKVYKGEDSKAQAHSNKDSHGQSKVNYAYLKLDSNGVRSWWMTDSYGVEIRTNITESEMPSNTEKDEIYRTIHNTIADQIKTGQVLYADRPWALTVARQLGYQIDAESGRVIKVRDKDIDTLDGALYHGFAEKMIGQKEEEVIDTDPNVAP